MAARQEEKEYVTDDESSEEEENSDLSDDSEDSDDDELLDEVVSELRKKVESSVNLSEKDKSILTFLNQRKFRMQRLFGRLPLVSIVGSVVECSPATRAARVRFPDDANLFSGFTNNSFSGW